MTDVHTPAQRSFNMSRIRGKDTSPELVVRSLAHRLGYRFKLHVRALPGCPDLVFPSRRKIILVHGCFWHSHHCKYGRVKPKANAKFWTEKRSGNRKRDEKNRRLLRSQGWQVLTIWECSVRNSKYVVDRISKFLQAGTHSKNRKPRTKSTPQ